MREFKKYFFEGLLQLTILATLLRQSPYYHTNHDRIRLLEDVADRNLSLIELSYLNSTSYLDKIDDSSHVSDELRRLNRLLELETTPAPPLRFLPPPRLPPLTVAPSFFFMNNNNQKDVSETRLLLNSIEFNNNQLTKEVR